MGRKKPFNLAYAINSAIERGEKVAVFTGSDKTGITFERVGKSVMWSDGKWASATLLESDVRVFIEHWEHYWSGVSFYQDGKYVGDRTIGTTDGNDDGR